jgi:WD40 repeat protein
MSGLLPSRFIIACGTYDGVIAGWDSAMKNEKASMKKATKKSHLDYSDSEDDDDDEDNRTTANAPLQLTFAMPSHEGSVRSVSIQPPTSSSPSMSAIPPQMVSAGYDEMIRVYSLAKRLELGESRTPPSAGTPTSSVYCGPNHLAIGTTEGKIIVYETKTFNALHVMGGHTSNVTTLCAHPDSKGGLLLSCSSGDGTIRLWDMLKGRMAYVTKIHKPTNSAKTASTAGSTSATTASINDSLSAVKFSPSGSSYAYAHGKTLVIKDTLSGEILLSPPPMPSKINDLCYTGPVGDYVALALDDGSMPLFKIEEVDDSEIGEPVVRATMAVEPSLTGVKSGELRMKKLEPLSGGSGYLVVSSNSAGEVTIWDLEACANGLMDEEEGSEDSLSDDEWAEDDEEEEGTEAVIMHKVKLGTGARIMCIAVWSSEGAFVSGEGEEMASDSEDEEEEEEEVKAKPQAKKRSAPESSTSESSKGGKGGKKGGFENLLLRQDQRSAVLQDAGKVAKARNLIERAKKVAKKSAKKLATKDAKEAAGRKVK